MRTRPACAAAALLAAALLAGCTAHDPAPAPTASRTAAPPASPTPQPTIAPAQKQVGPPADENDALQAAQATVNGYETHYFALQANPGLGPHYLDNWIAGPSEPYNVAQTVAVALQTGQRVAGKPGTFSADMSRSYTGEVTQDGTTYPNAIAYLVGCASNVGTKFIGFATPPPSGAAPYGYTVTWEPSSRTWMVTGENPDATGETC